MTIAEDLNSAIQRYDQALKDETLSEAQVDAVFEEAEKLVPNARLSELFFYGERERSREETVEEALYREELWERGGERAVLLHVLAQVQAVMDDPNAGVMDKVVSEQVLSGAQEELADLAGKMN